MRWLNVLRVRRVLKRCAETYENSTLISKAKSTDFVMYLRARRAVNGMAPSTFISHAKKNRAWNRKEHFKRKRLIACNN